MSDTKLSAKYKLIDHRTSSYLQKIDSLRWTPHMDECLEILDERKECLSDDILVQQVRLQLISEKMAQATLHNGKIEYNNHTKELSLYLETLHSQFQDMKTNLLARRQTDGKSL
jgi:hypothetical protein